MGTVYTFLFIPPEFVLRPPRVTAARFRYVIGAGQATARQPGNAVLISPPKPIALYKQEDIGRFFLREAWLSDFIEMIGP
jgi:hypothetical protein